MNSSVFSRMAAALGVSLACSMSSAFASPPVAGPQVWLRADAGVVLDGDGAVERWEDQSGNGHHFEQSLAARRPAPVTQAFVQGGGHLVRLPRAQNGNSTWSGSLGMDFVVDEEVEISSLAAFDHLRDGIQGTITVQLWSRIDNNTPFTPSDDQPGVILEQLTFTAAEPGDLDGAYRWKALPNARVLAPGSYSLVSFGYTGSDLYYYSPGQCGGPESPGIRWVVGGRYGGSTAWPTVVQSTYADYYGGSLNLRYRVTGRAQTSRPALRFDGADDGLQAPSSLNIGRPSSVFVVFEREDNQTGYILQNSTGTHWFLRQDGFYTNGGWVRNITIPSYRPQLAAMTQSSSGTRAYLQLSDLTHDGGRTLGNPGRLAIGGGSGLGNDPLAAVVAEVLVYDRVLDDSEMWQVRKYLADRYPLFEMPVANPQISPPGDIGTGQVTVSLSCPTPGAEIRYTLDGTDPQGASTLYAAPFSVARGTEVRARAFLAGLPASGVVSHFYGDAGAEDLPVTGATLWLRGDRGLETDASGAVLRWADLTGNGNDFLQGTESQRPIPVDAFPVGGGAAIRSPGEGSAGNTHNGTLGADFVVDSPIQIDQLGAYDHQADGFQSAVVVQIWSRNDQGTAQTPQDDTAGSLLAEMEFTPESPGDLRGFTRYKPLAVPLSLPAGSYSILAWGFTGANWYRNSSDASGSTEGIRFVGVSRYSSSNGAWPTIMDSHPVKYNGVGNFLFRSTAAPVLTQRAVRFDGANDGLWAGENSNIGRPSTVFVVFERRGNGTILQNTSSNWWFIRQDGGYSNGWVANRTVPQMEPVLATMSNGPAGTRFFVNGEDWTTNDALASATPGRLALGGANGYSANAIDADVAELLVFDRVLDAGELWALERYFSNRYNTAMSSPPAVAISPASGIGSGEVTVTLASTLAEAEIRYTLDGSDPTQSSALYSVPLSVPRGTEVKARAYLPDSTAGVIASAFYGDASSPDVLPVSGAAVWLQAGRGLELDDSGQVRRWADLSGNANDFIQEISWKRPAVDSLGLRNRSGAAILPPMSQGNATYGGTLGDDFEVLEEIEISHLGAFDHRGDGFGDTVTVQLWRRDDKGTPANPGDDSAAQLLATATFTSGDPGVLEGVSRFKALAESITLTPGAYTVYSWGYTNGNQYLSGSTPAAAQDERVRFSRGRSGGSPATWPPSTTTPLVYNGAANFKFLPIDSSAAAAVVFDGSDDGLIARAGVNIGRPSTVFVSYRSDRGESGYLIQNQSGQHWFIRQDGFYSNGWVRNENLPQNQPMLVAMSMSPSGTRAWRNGYEVTVNGALTSGSPGRITLGGGEGIGNDPYPVRITEIVVFDRELNPTEMAEMHRVLGNRSGALTPTTDAPQISPVAGYGVGNVTVSLASVTTTGAIRYTIDGTEPDESSALYTSPFSVPRGTEVKARVFAEGFAAGPVARTFYGDASGHPLPVPDAALWLRADVGVDSDAAGRIQRWRDLSGNGRDMFQNVPESMPSRAQAAFGEETRGTVRFDGSNDGLLGDPSFVVERPSTIFMVYRQNSTSMGRLIQSGSGRNWLLGPHGSPQGFYAEGWVTQHSIPANTPMQAIAVMEPDRSRYFSNGVDLTQSPHPTGAPGRLMLGGAEGTYFQPTHADLAELVVYTRVLSDAERQQVYAALAARYATPLENLLAPLVSPDGGLYQDAVTVALSHEVPGAVIRYTLDGTEPDESSPIYSGPLTLQETTTLRSRAFADGYAAGVIRTSLFEIDAAAPIPPRRQDLALWLRAENGVEESAGAVSLWRDASGKGMHATQGTAANRPLLVPNAIGGASALAFDGSNDFLQLPAGFRDFTQGMTAMFVVRSNGNGNWERYIDLGRGAAQANVFFGRSGTTNSFQYNGIITAPETLTPLANSQFTLVARPGGPTSLFHNGSLVATVPTYTTPANVLRTINYVGRSNWSSDAFLNGWIGEIVLYTTALEDVERETFETQMRGRYGIATSATGTVGFSPSTATLYPGGVEVSLSCVTPDARIHYTLDGSVPDESSALYSAPIPLTASTRIRARAFADDFNPSQFSEATYLIGLPPSSGDGLQAEYFDEIDFTGASLTRVDPNIQFNWGGGSPDPAIQPDTFSVRWTGKIMPRFTEAYTLYTQQDDGMRLWVDLNRDGAFDDSTERVINQWAGGGEREYASAPLALTAGLLYDIKVEYFEQGGSAVSRLLWSSFSEPKAAVPQSQLFSNAAFSQTVATPVISPAGGTYTAAVNVTISTATSGSTIHYTTDGTIPDTTSPVYTASFEVGATAQVRARAYRGGFNPSGVATVNYLIDAQPPLITAFQWSGGPLLNGAVLNTKGTLQITATDNQGVARTDFFYQPAGTTTRVPLGSATPAGGSMSLAWDIAGVADGNYTVIARVFDNTGTWAETSRSVTVALAVPPAPLITQPATGTTIQEPSVTVRIETLPGANIRIFRDGVFIFSGYANSAGVLQPSISLLTGTNTLTAVSRNRAGDSPPSPPVDVTRVREFPQLALSFDGNTVGEGGPLEGTVSLPAATAQNLSVTLSTNKPSQMETLDPVVIPAGATSANFILVARQDTLIELPSTVIVSANAVEHRAAQAELFLSDDDYPLIALELDQETVSESHGNVTLTVRRDPVTDRAVRVDLSATPSGQLNLPAFVEIPANSAVRTVQVPVLDNAVLDGNRLATIDGTLRVSGIPVALATGIDLEIRDDEGPLLTLLPQKDYLQEGSSMAVTITRAGVDHSTPLTVGLFASPSGQVSWPASVVIPAGQNEIQVTLSAPANPASSGSRSVSLRAGSPGYTDGIAPVTITDLALPELRIGSISAPATALSETYFNVSYQIRNDGFAPASTQFLERVYLSRDLVLDSNDLLLRQVTQSGNVAAQASYVRNLTLLAPREAGHYHVIVTVDAGEVEAELDETNNLAARAEAVEVRPAYSAVVSTEAGIIPANTPVLLAGTATRDGGGPAPFSMVNIHIRLNGTERIVSAVTNALGQFSLTWNPLRNEGGVYTIGAVHPGLNTAPVQDSFEILTLGVNPPGWITLNEGESAASQVELRNPNGRALTGITFEIGSLPAGLTITGSPPATTIPAGETMAVPLSITAAAGFSGYGQFPVTVRSAEGVMMQALVSVRVELLKPVLVVDRGTLESSIIRGTPKSESFTVTNTGGLESGPVQVLLPDVPWMRLSSANPIPSLPPGGSASVSLTLSPGTDVPLNVYTGNLALRPANGTGIAVPYRFRTVSDLKGDLTIDVVDELFFFTAEAPKLAGARVVVRDAISSLQIAEQTTGTDGIAHFPDLNEGWYRIEVTAPDHDSHSGNYYVNAGQANERQIFISKQMVKYSWSVEEVEIQDTYRVTIETTFETNVPAPVVTITPGSFTVEDLVALGQTKTVNLTLTNHGFIAAQNSRFVFSEHPFYEFLPLVENVGTIPAKSSLVVPVVITRIGIFDDEGNVVTLRGGNKRFTGGSVSCGAGGRLEFNFPCGSHFVEKAAALAISGVAGNCGGSGPGGSGGGYLGFIGGFYGGGGSGPGGGTGPGASSGTGPALSSPDPCLQDCLLKAALDCAIGYVPGLGCVWGAASCGNATGDAIVNPSLGSAGDALVACGGAVLGCVKSAPVVGAIINTGVCAVNFGICYYKYGGNSGGREVPAGGFLFEQAYRDYAPEVGEAWERVEAYLRLYQVLMGSQTMVMAAETPEGRLLHERYALFIEPDSDGGRRIDAGEEAVLIATGLSASVAEDVVAASVARWNRTVDYNAAGIFFLADVPEGDSTDFIEAQAFLDAMAAAVDAMEISRNNGYTDPLQEFLTVYGRFKADMEAGEGGACARVKVQISQDVMMTRTAFRATLELENQRPEELEMVGFELKVRDELGLPAEDLFNIQVSRLTGLDAIDGTGQIGSRATGTAQWTLIPRDTAAQTEERRYTVGGTIRYRQGGVDFTIPVANVPITVRPDASLHVKYFHQRDVYSDDPYTDAIEPAEPYKLSVMVTNNGYGQARNLKIISGQPQIIENEKGLFIDFKIIGTEVDGQPLSPSLTADFGTLDPGQRKIATWLMVSSLQGLFTEYSATFEHVTGLGDSRLSLMEEVSIHEMIRSVVAQGARDDGRPDFLTNDVADPNDFPDTVHYSDGGTDLVTVRQTGTFSTPPSSGNLSITLTTAAFSGWSYIRLPDPAAGNFRLVSVTRADGRVLPLDANAWQTSRTFIGRGKPPRYEHILHLADHDSSGEYTLQYEPVLPPDVTPPTSSIAALPAQSLPQIPVTWSGSDDQSVAFYDVYVSENDGPFLPWVTRTTLTGGLFTGTAGASYAFYSVATDSTGNVESKAALAEAETSVALENLPPVIAAIPDQSVEEGEIFRLRATASDPDGDDTAIRFSLGSTTPGVNIDPVTGDITLNTSEGDAGRNISVIVIARDAGFPQQTANRGFQLSVVPTNSPPVITPVGPQTLEPNGVLLVAVQATDSDVPAQTLAYSLVEAPSGASIHPSSGLLSWTPQPDQTGLTHLFTVRVTDSGSPASAADMSFSVNVLDEPDRPPVFTRVPVVLWTKGRIHNLTVAASDPDGDPIALSANVSATPGAAFSDAGNGQGNLQWDPSEVAEGTYLVPLTASANGKSANATVRIRVEGDDLYWNWARETFGELPDGFDFAQLGQDADADGDGRDNVSELALLTHPLRPDEPKLDFSLVSKPPLLQPSLRLHRRAGSQSLVDFTIFRASGLNGPWSPVPAGELLLEVDRFGDDDGRPETESMDFDIYEFHPEGAPAKGFYRLETKRRPAGP